MVRFKKIIEIVAGILGMMIGYIPKPHEIFKSNKTERNEPLLTEIPKV